MTKLAAEVFFNVLETFLRIFPFLPKILPWLGNFVRLVMTSATLRDEPTVRQLDDPVFPLACLTALTGIFPPDRSKRPANNWLM